VIHPKAMSRKEREILAKKGGLESAKKDFGRAPETQRPEKGNDVRREFAAWIRKIARTLKLRVRVRYVSAPDATFVAQCSPSRSTPRVTINTSFCPDAWLAERGPEQLGLIIHELAHALADTPMEHGPTWGEACATAGAVVADAIARGRLRYEPGAKPTQTNRALAEDLTAVPEARAS